MDEEFDQPLLFETLAASLELDKKETRQLIESLSIMLQGALPDNVSVTRGGWILSKDKPVENLLVKFDEIHYQIEKVKGGTSYSAKALKIVRGVALKTTEMTVSDCIAQIVEQVTALSEKNSRMRIALQKFVRG
jgi:hypothetical protein